MSDSCELHTPTARTPFIVIEHESGMQPKTVQEQHLVAGCDEVSIAAITILCLRECALSILQLRERTQASE